MNSWKFEITKLDLQKWFRTAIIIYTPTLLLFLSQLQEWQLQWSLLYTSALSISIDLVRRFVTNYKEQYES